MSRRDNHSMQLRGVPLEVLDRLGALARAKQLTKNDIVLEVVRDYAAGTIAPAASPPPFDANRAKASAYGADTGSLAVSGIPLDTFGAFMDRAKRDGWFSKNALIVELLRDVVAP